MLITRIVNIAMGKENFSQIYINSLTPGRFK